METLEWRTNAGGVDLDLSWLCVSLFYLKEKDNVTHLRLERQPTEANDGKRTQDLFQHVSASHHTLIQVASRLAELGEDAAGSVLCVFVCVRVCVCVNEREKKEREVGE